MKEIISKASKYKSIKERKYEVDTDYLIESIHIPVFIRLLEPTPPVHVAEAAARLRYRSQVYLFITLNKEKIMEEQCIYFADTEIPFSRVSEMNNFSKKMSPPHKSSLLLEFFCNLGDRIYDLKAEELLNLSIPFLEKHISLKISDIRGYYRFHSIYSYHVYDLAYETNLIVRRYLDSFDNLFYIGRPGRFEYTSQPRSIEMGTLAAQAIMNKKT
jgi:protoporphyrinogen oxidase